MDGVAVSVGVGPTKTLAKVANHVAKKTPDSNGVCHFGSADSSECIRSLQATEPDDVWGIGRRLGRKLKSRGVHNAWDLRNLPDTTARSWLTITGLRTVRELRGISCIELEQVPDAAKTICRSRSFGQPVCTREGLHEALATFVSRAAEKLREQRLLTNLVRVFIMTNRFKERRYANSFTVPLALPSDNTEELLEAVDRGLTRIFRPGWNYNKAGILLLGLIPRSPRQLDLFDTRDHEGIDHRMTLIDAINHRYGSGSIQYATCGVRHGWSLRRELLSPSYTTRWSELPRARVD